MNHPAFPLLKEKYEKLQTILRNSRSVAIAFSGGVDSSFLFKVATDELQEKAMALFVRSTVTPPGEFEKATAFAQLINGKLIVEELNPLAWPEFVDNPENRCYLCKKKIFFTLIELAQKKGMDCFSDGTNVDDLSDYRPGMKAAKELGTRSMLVEAGFTKDEIRAASRILDLPTWNYPSSSCLATRIPVGSKITVAKLDLIAKCEMYLNKLGFHGCRVRINDDCSTARIELAAGDIERFFQGRNWEKVKKFVISQDFDKVFLDLSERPCILNFDM